MGCWIIMEVMGLPRRYATRNDRKGMSSRFHGNDIRRDGNDKGGRRELNGENGIGYRVCSIYLVSWLVNYLVN